MNILTTNQRYEIIYIDPPWDYGGRTQYCGRNGRGLSSAAHHYPTMTIDELRTLPIPAAMNSVMYMWATGPKLAEAMELGEAWGYKYKTVGFTWVKNRPIPGHYTMPQSELCLVFGRGAIPKPRGSRNERQLITAPRREHSRKPDEAYERIEALHPSQSKLEMFARSQRAGWDSWGNETGKFSSIPMTGVTSKNSCAYTDA